MKAWPEVGRKGIHKGFLFDFGCTFRFSLSLNLLSVPWEMILLALVGFYKNIHLESQEKCKLQGHSLARDTHERPGTAEMEVFPSMYSDLNLQADYTSGMGWLSFVC